MNEKAFVTFYMSWLDCPSCPRRGVNAWTIGSALNVFECPECRATFLADDLIWPCRTVEDEREYYLRTYG